MIYIDSSVAEKELCFWDQRRSNKWRRRFMFLFTFPMQPDIYDGNVYFYFSQIFFECKAMTAKNSKKGSRAGSQRLNKNVYYLFLISS